MASGSNIGAWCCPVMDDAVVLFAFSQNRGRVLAGIMDEAYFVGRKAILAWINDTFSLNVAKIEDTASGTVAHDNPCPIGDSRLLRLVPSL